MAAEPPPTGEAPFSAGDRGTITRQRGAKVAARREAGGTAVSGAVPRRTRRSSARAGSPPSVDPKIAALLGEVATLTARAARLQELLEHANDIVYTHDLDGCFTYVNETGLRLFGYSLAEATALNLRDVVDAGFIERVRRALAEQVAGVAVVPFEVLTHTRDGREVVLEASTRVLRDDAGTPTGIQGIARDITERKRAQEELEASRELLRATIESTADGILVVDSAGRVVHANRRFATLWRIPDALLAQGDDDGLIGFVLEQLSEPEAFTTKVRALYASMEEDLDELSFKDGRVFERYSRPLLAARLVAGRVWSFRDITEHRHAEAALTDSEQLYRQIFDGHSAIQVLVDLETRRVIEPNAAACAFYGYERDAFIGMEVSVIDSPPPDQEGGADGAAPGERRGSLRRLHTLASGEVRSVEVFPCPVDVRGKRLMLVMVQDVTDRDRAQETLVEQRRLLDENAARLALALEAERERGKRDPLTGTLNHGAIIATLREMLSVADADSFAVAMVDVDGLKAANDTYGHQTGDEVLAFVARALHQHGAVVGRYGGDEFLALLPGARREAAERYRDAVTQILAEATLADPDTNKQIAVVASIGVAMYPEEATASDDLIRAADTAMFTVKRQRAAGAKEADAVRVVVGDPAARMVGEIVPFLTSPGSLDEKLRLVAQRLTAGAGYAGVSFALFPEAEEDPPDLSSFAEAPQELVEKWDVSDAEEAVEEEPLRPVLERIQRPVIIDDIAATPFVNEMRRELLLAAGIHSAIVAPMIWQGKVVGTLSAGGRECEMFRPRDAQFLNAVATQVTAIVRTASLVDELQSASTRLSQAHTESVLLLASAAEAHDQSTGRHLHRVRSIAQALARELGHDEESAEEIGLAAVLHDIGKIRVPDYVLMSPDSLADDEWDLMKRHTLWGAEFLGSRPGFRLAAEVARCHHERWDGTGYPVGLAEKQIPEAAAITSVADSLDAMTSDRPYRSGRPLSEAMLELQAWSGRQFSPRIVEALLRLYERGALPDLEDGTRDQRDHEARAA